MAASPSPDRRGSNGIMTALSLSLDEAIRTTVLLKASDGLARFRAAALAY